MDHIFAKKSLGQNWLVSQSALQKIIDAASLKPGEQVLEIGPGRGALTERLLAADAKVTAIEKDRRLMEPLAEKFKVEIEKGQLTLLECDALDLPPNLLQALAPYKLVANIPYYITGEIIRQFLEAEHQPTQAVILVQKEVADRIVALNHKESILSLSVKAYGVPKLIAKVPRGAFRPVPNVDSAILAISDINKNYFGDFTEKAFFDLIKKGFAQKRKLLRSNLNLAEGVLTSWDLPEKSRAEDLTLTDWQNLL
ncbi:MAG: ribosomal RNA small subunit methyltransferase A [Candidatus Vogelbacteria bacterium RIFOXYD1_FULL_46_19]|uniref:Ribosomal RNA small subunit methyltransferase A n=1 Tax=Candidatus Vogelbacteria bacterium RIFOXYD1_FULL_46_19 TaxID=1802439 RepID=A0A1G2QI39_9BACT|nr:MAG: ribosomal RNA small subunit methyltransferase A [Candidatus Vogelbacteria bacterium RIFOXYD1_FULL_46_19]